MPQAIVEKLRREAGRLAARIYEEAYRSALERYGDPARAARIAIAAVRRHFYQDRSGRWRRRRGHVYRDGRWYVNGKPVEGATMATVFYDDAIVRSLVELGEQPLEGAEAPKKQWLLLVPVGRWQHPVYGKVVIRPEDVEEMAANFRAGKLGTDVPVDYPDHRDDSQGAYGWVREVEARDDGLWGLLSAVCRASFFRCSARWASRCGRWPTRPRASRQSSPRRSASSSRWSAGRRDGHQTSSKTPGR